MKQEERYARHLVLDQVGLAGQLRLKAARVLVIGAGGLGSPVALYLAAAGVGHITLVDPDRVSLSNLQRQILFKTSEVGELKVEKAREALTNLNNDIFVEALDCEFGPRNARELVHTHDLVIDGSDNFRTRFCVNDACVLEGKPLVSGALHKFEAQVTVLNHEGGPCYRCLFPEPPPVEAIPNCQEAGVLGVLPGLAGTLMATEALKIILQIGETLSGKLLHIDALTTNFSKRGFRGDVDCAVCGAAPRIRELEIAAHVPSMTWSELADRPDDAFLLDVRNPDEVESQAVHSFVNVPLAQLNRELAAGILADLPKDRNVVVVCQTGKRSARAVEILSAAGYGRVAQIEGGLAAKGES